MLFENCHLKAYPDPLSGGKPITIGWGSTRKSDGSEFKLGELITQEEADSLFAHQIETRYLPKCQKIPHWQDMSKYQRAALLSFAYNLGADFYGSKGFSTITAKLRDRNWNDIPLALMLYRNPGSEVELGLARRRFAEGLVWRGAEPENAYHKVMGMGLAKLVT